MYGVNRLICWTLIVEFIIRKMSDGMFLSACREVSKEFPDVAYDEDLLDRVCLRVCCFWRWNFSELSNAIGGYES